MSRVSSFLNNLLGSRKNKSSIIVNNVTVRPIVRKAQDIQSWRNALKAAEGYTQQRAALYDLYSELMLDGVLNRCVEKRIITVTNKAMTFAVDGKVVEEVQALTEKSFFGDLLREIMNARFWGHSLIEPIWPAPNSSTKAETCLIPRKNVKPRFGIVTKEHWDMNGVDYTKPPFAGKLIEVGKPDELGLLLQAAQYVIYKRGGFGDWAEFAEVFGMPFRWATYTNEDSRAILEQAMQEAGSAGYVVAPADANIQFQNQHSTTGTQIFKQLRDACNEEISICILGNTMTTTEAKNSGYAQSKTHKEGEDEIKQDDRMFLLRVLNEQLTPILERLGYPVKGGKWSYIEEDGTSKKDKLDIALKVSEKVPVPDDYWYETFAIPKPDPSEIKKKASLKPESSAPKDKQ